MIKNFGLIVLVITAYVFICSIIKFRSLPEKTCNGKVLSKRISKNESNNTRSYYVKFSVYNNTEELKVRSREFYDHLEVGMEGTLIYKGNVLMNFIETEKK